MKVKFEKDLLVIEIESCNDILEMLSSSGYVQNIVKIEGECRMKIYIRLSIPIQHGGVLP